MGRKPSASQTSNQNARNNPGSTSTSSSSNAFAANSEHARQSQSLPQGAGAGGETPGSSAGGRNGGEAPGWPLSLPNHPKQVVSMHELRQQALEVYSKIGTKFNRAYDTSVTGAMRNLLMDLRANQRLLVEGGLYTARELDDRVEQLQSYLKVGGDEGKTSMQDRFHQWLNDEEQQA